MGFSPPFLKALQVPFAMPLLKDVSVASNRKLSPGCEPSFSRISPNEEITGISCLVFRLG